MNAMIAVPHNTAMLRLMAVTTGPLLVCTWLPIAWLDPSEAAVKVVTRLREMFLVNSSTEMVGLRRIELRTSALSVLRSNHLS